MDESPKLHFVLLPIAMGVFLGLVAGIILSWNAVQKHLIIVGSMFGGGLLGFWISSWFIGQRERWFFYAWDADNAVSQGGNASADADKIVLSLVIVDDKGQRMSKEIHGLSLDEWRQLGAGVVKYKFEYSSRILQAIFTPSRGATIYSIVTPMLRDVYIGILIPNGSNGVRVNDDRGERFFEQLQKGDYEILRVLDAPQSPPPARDMA